MADALNLFLGDNTSSFVEWLHEVLDKLQKVRLPKKVKSTNEADKKEKKKKEKEHQQKEADDDQNKIEDLPALPPITEVIKEGFLKRAQHDMEVEATVKTKKQDDVDFDIPSVNDQQITETEGETQSTEPQHQYDLQQLQEIQEKIYAAKQQLRTLASDEASSEDEDIELSDYDDINEQAEQEENADKNKEPSEPPSTPPPMETNESASPTRRPSIHINPNFLQRREKITAPTEEPEHQELEPNVDDDIASDGDEQLLDSESTKRVVKLSAIRRAEREIYVPKFRRIEMMKRLSRSKAEEAAEPPRGELRNRQESARNRLQIDRRENRLNYLDVRRKLEPRNRTRSPPLKLRSRSPVPSRRRTRSPPAPRPAVSRRKSRTPPLPPKQQLPSPKSQKLQQAEDEMRRELLKKRIGSKVTVAPPRPPSEEVDVAVNSQITVKPRPKVPASKQANKLLLLKAVAEAQLSTFQAKKRPRSPIPLANRSKRGVHGNIVVKVPHLEEEYVPLPLNIKKEIDSYMAYGVAPKEDTQFVVTLTGAEKLQKRARNYRSDEENEDEEVRRIFDEKPKRPVKERIGYRMRMDEDEETKRRRKERFDRLYERKTSPKKSRSSSRSPQTYRNRRESSYENNSRSYENNSRRDRGRERDRSNRYDNNNDRRDNHRDTRYRSSPYRNSARYESSSHMEDNRNNETDNKTEQSNKFYSANVANPKIQELVDNESRHSGTSHSNTPPIRRRHRARTISPINFDLTDEEVRSRDSDDDFESRLNKENEGEKKPSQLKKIESTNKFDNLPTCK